MHKGQTGKKNKHTFVYTYIYKKIKSNQTFFGKNLLKIFFSLRIDFHKKVFFILEFFLSIIINKHICINNKTKMYD